MKNKILLTIFSLIHVTIQTAENDPQLNDRLIEMKAEDSSEKLSDATQRYLTLINKISQAQEFSQEEIESVLAPDCKKIFNGKLYTENREDFISDLIEVNRTKGCWSINPLATISSPQSRTMVLHLMIDMDNVGAFTAMVILRFNSSYLISEINEVSAKWKIHTTLMAAINETKTIGQKRTKSICNRNGMHGNVRFLRSNR